jgi:hypothetical protein
LLHMTLTGFGLKSTSSISAEEKQASFETS